MFAQLLDFIDKDVFLRIANKSPNSLGAGTCLVSRYLVGFPTVKFRETLSLQLRLMRQRVSPWVWQASAKSTLTDDNTKRDYRIFEKLAYKNS